MMSCRGKKISWKKLLIWERKQAKVGRRLPTATNMADIEAEIEPVPSVLLPCSSCNRTFRPEALVIHAKVCEKTLLKKRKQFDSAKQRIQGTDLAQFLPNIKNKQKNTGGYESGGGGGGGGGRGGGGGGMTTSKSDPVAKWKEKCTSGAETTVRVNRVVRRSSSRDRVGNKNDHEQCPHCERYFGQKAFSRHVDWCKDQRFKLPHQDASVVEAKERLMARTKYQPPLIKSSRALTKEKYSRAHTEQNPPMNQSVSVAPASRSSDRSRESTNISLERNSSLRNSSVKRSPVNRTYSSISRKTEPTRQEEIPTYKHQDAYNWQNNNNNPKAHQPRTHSRMGDVPHEKRSSVTRMVSESSSLGSPFVGVTIASCVIHPVSEAKTKTPPQARRPMSLKGSRVPSRSKGGRPQSVMSETPTRTYFPPIRDQHSPSRNSVVNEFSSSTRSTPRSTHSSLHHPPEEDPSNVNYPREKTFVKYPKPVEGSLQQPAIQESDYFNPHLSNFSETSLKSSSKPSISSSQNKRRSRLTRGPIQEDDFADKSSSDNGACTPQMSRTRRKMSSCSQGSLKHPPQVLDYLASGDSPRPVSVCSGRSSSKGSPRKNRLSPLDSPPLSNKPSLTQIDERYVYSTPKSEVSSERSHGKFEEPLRQRRPSDQCRASSKSRMSNVRSPSSRESNGSARSSNRDLGSKPCFDEITSSFQSQPTHWSENLSTRINRWTNFLEDFMTEDNPVDKDPEFLTKVESPKNIHCTLPSIISNEELVCNPINLTNTNCASIPELPQEQSTPSSPSSFSQDSLDKDQTSKCFSSETVILHNPRFSHLQTEVADVTPKGIEEINVFCIEDLESIHSVERSGSEEGDEVDSPGRHLTSFKEFSKEVAPKSADLLIECLPSLDLTKIFLGKLTQREPIETDFVFDLELEWDENDLHWVPVETDYPGLARALCRPRPEYYSLASKTWLPELEEITIPSHLSSSIESVIFECVGRDFLDIFLCLAAEPYMSPVQLIFQLYVYSLSRCKTKVPNCHKDPAQVPCTKKDGSSSSSSEYSTLITQGALALDLMDTPNTSECDSKWDTPAYLSSTSSCDETFDWNRWSTAHKWHSDDSSEDEKLELYSPKSVQSDSTVTNSSVQHSRSLYFERLQQLTRQRNHQSPWEIEKYDPFVSAELQMMELLKSEPEGANSPPPRPERPGPEGAQAPSSPQTASSPQIAASPQTATSPSLPGSSSLSAFARFSPVSSPPSTSPPPKPASAPINNNSPSDGSDSPTTDPSRKFSLSNLSLCSVISIDSLDLNKNKGRGLGRCTSVLEGKPNTRAARNKLNMHHLLYGQSPDDPSQPIKDKRPNPKDLQACEAELLVSMLEFERMLQANTSPTPTHQPFPNFCSSSSPHNTRPSHPEGQSAANPRGDSAYSSLSRRTPEDGPLDPNDNPTDPALSKFCHECGAKYPVPGAKFCCQCGIRRIAI